jgi:hypothetical protein
MLNIKLVYKHSPPTKWIESWVDSGAHSCMFHAGFCKALGIDLKSGIETQLAGVIGVVSQPIYFHKVKILIGSEQFETMVGFSENLSVAGLLGRRGFFENSIVKIDSSVSPPVLEVEKIHRL